MRRGSTSQDADTAGIAAISAAIIEGLVPRRLLPDAGGREPTSVLSRRGLRAELVAHLTAHRQHYTHAALRSLTSSDVLMALGDTSYDGKPVLDLVDPTPVAIEGNQVVFRMPGLRLSPEDEVPAKGDSDWATWVDEVGLLQDGSADSLVPLPSGGVFAEAVLGRSNSAEKLDLTRFWNWQDSPIPLQPPEIASIAMGGRGQQVEIELPDGGTPTLIPQQAPAAPDPTGLAAVLQTMAAGSMFRDMSAAASTADLAKKAAELAVQQNTATQTQAGTNMKVAADKDVQLEQIKAQKEGAKLDLAKKVLETSASKGIASQNPSVQGGILNAARATESPASGGAAGAPGQTSPTAGSGSSLDRPGHRAG